MQCRPVLGWKEQGGGRPFRGRLFYRGTAWQAEHRVEARCFFHPNFPISPVLTGGGALGMPGGQGGGFPFRFARHRPGKTALAGLGQGFDIHKEVFCG